MYLEKATFGLIFYTNDVNLSVKNKDEKTSEEFTIKEDRHRKKSQTH
jgi:hypothetical protein